MSIYERLMGRTDTGSLPEGTPRIPQHIFPAALAERARGQLTNQQVFDFLGADPSEQAELVTLVGRFTQGGSRLTREEFEDAMYLCAARKLTLAAFRARIGV